jgi:hypothetical protein
MANYATAEDVSVLLGLDNFSTSSRPTLTQVNAIIADITKDIDFVLSGVGITTQPTDTNLLGRLAIACKYGVACHVGMSAFGNSVGVDNSQPDKYCKRYQEILTEIKESPELYGAVTGDAAMFVTNQVDDGTWTEDDTKDRYFDENYEV